MALICSVVLSARTVETVLVVKRQVSCFQAPFTDKNVAIIGRNDKNAFALGTNNQIVLQNAADLALDDRTSYTVSGLLTSVQSVLTH